jgi:hypothetical protein
MAPYRLTGSSFAEGVSFGRYQQAAQLDRSLAAAVAMPQAR